MVTHGQSVETSYPLARESISSSSHPLIPDMIAWWWWGAWALAWLRRVGVGPARMTQRPRGTSGMVMVLSVNRAGVIPGFSRAPVHVHAHARRHLSAGGLAGARVLVRLVSPHRRS